MRVTRELRCRGIVFGRPALRSPTTGGSQGLLVVAEVQVVTRGGRPALTLVFGPRRIAPVGVLGGAAHPEEGDLPDRHPRIDGDRQVRDIRELEREMPVESGIDEARG